MRRLILLIFLLLPLAATTARGAELAHREVLLFGAGETTLSSKALSRLDRMVSMLCIDSLMRVDIYGYTDRLGGESLNVEVSTARARSVAEYLLSRGVDSLQIHFEGCGVDHSADNRIVARRVDVVARLEVKPQSVEIDRAAAVEVAREYKQEHEREVLEESSPIVELTSAVEAEAEAEAEVKIKAKAREAQLPSGGFALRSNLLYWLCATPNIGFEYLTKGGVVALLLDGGYAPLASQEWNYNLGGWFVSPEVRAYIGARRSCFIGIGLTASDYNVKLSDIGYQGDLLAAGLTLGYRIYLGRNFDMDFSLGGGYGEVRYDSYRHYDINNSCVYVDKDVKRQMWLPLEAGVSLIWRIKR